MKSFRSLRGQTELADLIMACPAHCCALGTAAAVDSRGATQEKSGTSRHSGFGTVRCTDASPRLPGPKFIRHMPLGAAAFGGASSATWAGARPSRPGGWWIRGRAPLRRCPEYVVHASRSRYISQTNGDEALCPDAGDALPAARAKAALFCPHSYKLADGSLPADGMDGCPPPPALALR